MVGKNFCDLNIVATDSHLRETVLQALKLGYQTIAINTEVTDSWSSESKKKKRKKGDQGIIFICIVYDFCHTLILVSSKKPILLFIIK